MPGILQRNQDDTLTLQENWRISISQRLTYQNSDNHVLEHVRHGKQADAWRGIHHRTLWSDVIRTLDTCAVYRSTLSLRRLHQSNQQGQRRWRKSMEGSAHLHEIGPLDAEDELQVLHREGHVRASIHDTLEDGGLCQHRVVLHPTQPHSAPLTLPLEMPCRTACPRGREHPIKHVTYVSSQSGA